MLCGWVSCFALLCGRGCLVFGPRSRAGFSGSPPWHRQHRVGALSLWQPRMGPASSLPPRPPSGVASLAAALPLHRSPSSAMASKSFSLRAEISSRAGGGGCGQGPIRGCHRAGTPTRALTKPRQRVRNHCPRAWPADRNHRHPPGARSKRATPRTPTDHEKRGGKDAVERA